MNSRNRNNNFKEKQHQVPYPILSCRLLALSATLPNNDDIGHWLECRNTHIFAFGKAFRPVKLDVKFCTFEKFYTRNDYLFDKHLPEKLYEVFQNQYT